MNYPLPYFITSTVTYTFTFSKITSTISSTSSTSTTNFWWLSYSGVSTSSITNLANVYPNPSRYIESPTI